MDQASDHGETVRRMGSHQDTVESSRRLRRTMYLVASLYVGAGFVVTIPAAAAGETLTAFLGFLVISGALAATAMVNALLQLGGRAAAIEDKLRDLAEAVATLNGSRQTATIGSTVDGDAEAGSTSAMVDLTDAGLNDPSSLAAAAVDGEVYPRLVTLVDDGSHSVAAFETRAASTGRRTEAISDVATLTPPGVSDVSSEVPLRSLLHSWTAARQTGDLGACRSIYAALIDTADAELVETLRDQLAELSDSTRKSLRDRFAGHVRAGELGGAIEVGERLRELFPDSALSGDYERLKPILLRRMKAHHAGPSNSTGDS